MLHEAELHPLVLFNAFGAAGHVLLNRPKALHALNTEMIDLIDDQLTQWLDDPAVEFIVLEGQSRGADRPFCAGGDIKSAYYGLKNHHPDQVYQFFQHEYALNRFLAEYPKPVVILVDGVCMGGGLGLAAYGNLRILTDRARLAMPETLIGFFPDVGAGWFLNRVNPAVGMYLALTGAPFDAAQALSLDLADEIIPHDAYDKVREQILQAPSFQHLDHLIAPYRQNVPPYTWPMEYEACFTAPDIWTCIGQLQTMGATEVLEAFAARSPTALAVTYAHMRWSMGKSLGNVLDQELHIARAFLHHPDYVEGIRALLIDKDQTPKWQPSQLEMLTNQVINNFFP